MNTFDIDLNWWARGYMDPGPRVLNKPAFFRPELQILTHFGPNLGEHLYPLTCRRPSHDHLRPSLIAYKVRLKPKNVTLQFTTILKPPNLDEHLLACIASMERIGLPSLGTGASWGEL